MTSIRIVFASLFAAGTLVFGGAMAAHYADAPAVAHATTVASPVHCCDDDAAHSLNG